MLVGTNTQSGLSSTSFEIAQDRHVGEAGDDFRKQALAFRTEMGDDDNRQAWVGGQSAEEALERLDASGRSADADDRKG